jgi:TATA-binding protein-associated factor Taf7
MIVLRKDIEDALVSIGKYWCNARGKDKAAMVTLAQAFYDGKLVECPSVEEIEKKLLERPNLTALDFYNFLHSK